MLTKYARMDPFRDLLQLQNSLMHTFDTFDGPTTAHRHGEESAVRGAWQPLMDVFEDQDHIVVKLELPEVPEQDIDLRVEGNTLTVSGERKLGSDVEPEAYRLIERTYGSFRRAFNLPDTVDAEHVTAESKGGVLSIRLPKRAETKARQIKVQAEASLLDKKPAEKQ